MHVTKREGMRCIAMTEEEFNKVMSGFDRLKVMYTRTSSPPDACVETADMILIEGLQILAEDDGQE